MKPINFNSGWKSRVPTPSSYSLYLLYSLHVDPIGYLIFLFLPHLLGLTLHGLHGHGGLSWMDRRMKAWRASRNTLFDEQKIRQKVVLVVLAHGDT